eukprot:619218_1
MWLIIIALCVPFVIRCEGEWSFPISDHDVAMETGFTWFTRYDKSWTCDKPDDTSNGGHWWIRGLLSTHSNHKEDRDFSWYYGRPDASLFNTNYMEWPSLATSNLPQTAYDQYWNKECDDDDALYKVYSIHDNDREDRKFTFSCKAMLWQFSLINCDGYSAYVNDYDETFLYECPRGGVVKGISSKHSNHDEDRKWSFLCCDIQYTPMHLQSSNGDGDRLLTTISSSWNNGVRSYSEDLFGKPRWYKEGTVSIVKDTYQLTGVFVKHTFWTRVCPRNGALTQFKEISSNDDSFSFECGELIDDITVGDCEWTNFISQFHESFIGECAKDAPIRGMQSYKSEETDDRKFKLYCCELKRENYVNDANITIALKGDPSNSGGGVLTVNLCWNNHEYQGVVKGSPGVWTTSEDIVDYGTCGNDRILTVSTSSTDGIHIAAVQVTDNTDPFTIASFQDVNDYTKTNGGPRSPDFDTNVHDYFVLDGNAWYERPAITDVVILFPDDYLTSCDTENGCTGTLYNLDDYLQYGITITTCSSFHQSINPSISVIVRGLNGNLDKRSLTESVIDNVQIGTGNIGEILAVSIELDDGPDFCIESVIIHAVDHDVIFDNYHFGDGIILSTDCGNDGDFRRLSQIQFVPCHDTPLTLTTYEESLYTSVQIHACNGDDGGIAVANSGRLSLTVTGLSKSGTYIHKGPYSLKSSEVWAPGDSRDYTLTLAGGVEELSIVSITNNDADALCVDSVLINGEDAFLDHYWVGSTPDHDALSTIPAVLKWPICDVKIISTTLETPRYIPVDPDAVATATCVNRNRLVSVDCEISQTFETYEEDTWQHEFGQETLAQMTIEKGKEHTKSAEAGWVVLIEDSGTSGSYTRGRTWSSSNAVTTGTTAIDLTTDGRVDGTTTSITCSASVSVPPSQEIAYSLFIESSKVEIKTLTDYKMTKCSAFLYGNRSDPNDYIYMYGIAGTLTEKEATNCYVSFSQATQVSSGGSNYEEPFTCGHERALATREWATYVPQCDATDPTIWMKCQCADGDTLTSPTCGCVDESSGNLLDTAAASVVTETDTYKWIHWCEGNCGTGSYNVPAAYESIQSMPKIVPVKPVNAVPSNDNHVSDFSNMLIASSIMLIASSILFITIIYAVNSCSKKKRNAKKKKNTVSIE